MTRPAPVPAGPHGQAPTGQPGPARGRGPARSRARKAALDILFESDLRGLGTGATLADRQSDAAAGGPAVRDYTAEVVAGVREHRTRIDELLDTYAEGWPTDRMAAVDRTILRIAAWELLAAPSVPTGVVISEAVALARDLSTDASPAFVNGVLARVADVVPRGVGGGPADTDPDDTDPADTDPDDTDPDDTDPVGTDPVGADPADGGPADTGAADAEPEQGGGPAAD